MATNSNDTVASITQKLYELLEPLGSEERKRAIGATLTLLGESNVSSFTPAPSGGSAGGRVDENGDIRAFFDNKDPRNKIEELAVAARYRETFEGAQEHTKDDFEKAIKAARRNFDSNNFGRDLNNAKTKGLINRVPENTLAYYGQQYVDALPDREAVKAIKAPRGVGRKKGSKKKTTKKKTAKKQG